MKVGDRRDDPAEMQLKGRFALAQDTSSPDLLEQGRDRDVHDGAQSGNGHDGS